MSYNSKIKLIMQYKTTIRYNDYTQIFTLTLFQKTLDDTSTSFLLPPFLVFQFHHSCCNILTEIFCNFSHDPGKNVQSYLILLNGEASSKYF